MQTLSVNDYDHSNFSTYDILIFLPDHPLLAKAPMCRRRPCHSPLLRQLHAGYTFSFAASPPFLLRGSRPLLPSPSAAAMIAARPRTALPLITVRFAIAMGAPRKLYL